MDSALEKLESPEPLQTAPITITESSDEARQVHVMPCFALTLISSIIPVSALAIGLHFKGQCPIDRNIPQFMIVSGSCSLVLIVLVLLYALITVHSNDIDDSTSKLTKRCCLVSCWILMAIGGLILFMIIWLCFGCGSIFSVKQRVQFSDRANTATYCHPTLYYSSFVFAIASLALTTLFCCILHYFRPPRRRFVLFC